VVLDASSINVVDATAIQKADELKQELADNGIVFAIARGKPHIGNFFKSAWWDQRREEREAYTFITLKSAVQAFNKMVADGNTKTLSEKSQTTEPKNADQAGSQ